MWSASRNSDVASLPVPVQLTAPAQQFVDALPDNQPPLCQLTPQQGRQSLVDLQVNYPLVNKRVSIQDLILNCPHNNSQISLRITRPKSHSKSQDSCQSQHVPCQLLPIILYVHGGGWLLGDKATFSHLTQTLAVETQAAVVFVDYDRSPEAKYPVALEQIYTTLCFVAERGEELGLDGQNIAIVGDSVGGNMATVIAMLAKERNGPCIRQQVLLYPVTNAKFDTESYWKFANGPWLTRDNMQWFWHIYQPDVEIRNHVTMSPLQASLEQLAGLPPALIITNENDVLRDEGEAYAHKLMLAGVETVAFRCIGMIHDFALLNGMAKDSTVQFAINMVSLRLRQVFAN